MTDDMPAALDPELERLLAAEKRRGDAPAGAQREVFAELETLLAGGGGPPPDSSGGSSAGGSTSHSEGILRRARLFATSRSGAIALGAFVAGAAGGVWLRGAVPNTIIYVDRPVPASSVNAAPAMSPSSAPPPAMPIEALPQAPPRSAPAARSAGPVRDAGSANDARDTSLAAERALVETGRMALARGDHGSALDALDRHSTNFPKGQLAEEREALAIQALASSGRKREAVERGARFRLAHPDSVMLPVVDETLR